MIKLRITYFLLFLCILGIFSCARIVKPPGGPKDTQGPKASTSSPKHNSVNFKGKKIEIGFSEFVSLDDIENQLVISPIIDPKPDVNMKGKKLVIRLSEPLKENTTYNFNFGESIKDITEGNPLSGFQYTVATGAILDSMTISGQVTDAFTNQPKESIWLSLYKNPTDSSFSTKKPDYLAKTDKSGRYIFNALPAGTFKIYALNDLNSNLMYDLPNEEIGYLIEDINTDSSNVYNANIKTFIEKEDNANISGVSQTGHTSFVINYSRSVGEVDIIALGDAEFQVERHPSNEKDIIWFSEAFDSIEQVIVSSPELLTDTISLAYSPKYLKKPDSLYTVKEVSKIRGAGNKQEIDKPIAIYFNHPLSNVGDASVFLEGNAINVSTVEQGENPRRINVSADLEENKSYKILIDNTTSDIYGNVYNSKDSLSLETLSEDDYSQLEIKIENYDSSLNYVAGLYKELDEASLYKSFELRADSLITVDKILPGKYYLIVYDDENRNGRWDKGSFNSGFSPEMSWTKPKELSFKSKFVIDSKLNLKKD